MTKPPARKTAAPEWTPERNARRFQLIEREISGEITPDEAVELAELQSAADTYVQSVAPLPWSGIEAVHDELLKKARSNAPSIGVSGF